ncbi:MAG: chalcone isomerase family protein [Candidatus Omnitrophota bacterium]
MNKISTQNSLRKQAAFLLILLTVFICSSVHAAEISGVNFNEFYQDQGINMRLQGTGLKTMLFFKAFVAGYYTNMVKESDPLGDFPKRIEVEYFVNISGRQLNNYTIERMKVNISKVQFDHIKEQVKIMGEYFVDLRVGDRFSLTYIPGVGTKFAHNGHLIGVIRDRDFARALFSVWIGEKPFDNQLKRQIIGLANSRGDKNVY